LLSAVLALVVSSAAASAITVSTPANGAQVPSPFTLTASTSACGSVAAVSMGYSIDSGATVIEPTSFTAKVSAAPGAHVLHVKCWGVKTNADVLLKITIVQSTPTSGIAVSSPASGATVSSPFTVTASAKTCGSASAASMGYSIDDGAAVIEPTSFSASVTASAGSHTLHVKCWGAGAAEQVLLPITVGATTSSGPVIPDNALSDTEIQLMPNWRTKKDPATNGTAGGVMSIVSDPVVSGGQSAEFKTSYSAYGGVLYSVTYGKDSGPSNFVYDAEVWIAAGSTIGNLEMDNNQVISNGDTVIYAFQCAGTSNTWDYSENAGTRANPVVKWVRSNQPCNPANWTKNAWHHVQIQTSRDDVGNVTYHSVWLDGVEYPINQTVMSAFSLGWASADLIANFQVDGTSSSGASTLYLDDFTMYRW
jgi:hypothetical protein